MPHYNRAPCRECTERHSTCHDTCEKYRSWKRLRDEAVKAQREGNGADAVIASGVYRTLREKRRRKQ